MSGWRPTGRKRRSIGTDAATLNLMVLSTGVIAKRGTSCARLTGGSTSKANPKKQMTRIRKAPTGSCCCFIVNVSLSREFPL